MGGPPAAPRAIVVSSGARIYHGELYAYSNFCMLRVFA